MDIELAELFFHRKLHRVAETVSELAIAADNRIGILIHHHALRLHWLSANDIGRISG
jgi:hypothetical protein